MYSSTIVPPRKKPVPMSAAQIIACRSTYVCCGSVMPWTIDMYSGIIPGMSMATNSTMKASNICLALIEFMGTPRIHSYTRSYAQ